MVKVSISFKSLPELWDKEKENIKRNTVRRFYQGTQLDIRESVLNDFKDGINKDLWVNIVNTQTKEVFTRKVKDVTYFEGLYIISW